MDTKTGYAENYYKETCGEQDAAQRNASDYPVSSVARFMFLYDLKKKNDPRFQEVAKQTGIYLYNPLWADYQLSQSEKELVIEPKPDAPAVENDFNQEDVPLPVTEEKTENFISEAEQNISTEPVNEKIEPTAVEEELPAEVNEEKTEHFVSEAEQNLSGEPADEMIDPTHVEEELPAEVNEEKGQNFISESEQSLSGEPAAEMIEPMHVEEELPAEVKDEKTENFISETEGSETSEEIVSEKNEEAILNEEIVEVPEVEEAKPRDWEQQISPEENEKNEPIISKEENQEIDKNISASQIKIPSENETEPVDDEDETISFEPLHTVDYFASQGIRLSEEALNNDQLGKQVKSFTAWLKSMKKLHPGQLPEQNEVIEKLIQTSSEASNQNANVLTEAMAEVLVKQGKREKAIEMYQKLSLINPSKSAYFAAKIESLKSV
ncbi:MAG: hypothetical protein ACTHNG_06845 [Ginsengibacter sp.]